MQSIDMLLDTTREFLHQIAEFLPRLALSVAVVAVGWLVAKAVRFAVGDEADVGFRRDQRLELIEH